MSATNRGKARVANDFYPTPAWLTEAIVPALHLRVRASGDLRILEPACGEGAIVKALRKNFAWARIDSFDVVDGERYDFGTGVFYGEMLDFLKMKPKLDYDLIITNPPYSLAREFVEQAFKWRRDKDSLVVMLLRVNFLGSQERGPWLRAHTPSIYESPRRPSFGKNKGGKPGTDATEYARGRAASLLLQKS